MSASRMPAAKMRAMVALWPISKLRRWIADTRRTMRGPQYVGEHLVGGRQGPDVAFCARFIAVLRAAVARLQSLASPYGSLSDDQLYALLLARYGAYNITPWDGIEALSGECAAIRHEMAERLHRATLAQCRAAGLPDSFAGPRPERSA
jgi:hypothetical protein